MRTIAVINQKGGCGKTITAINLSGFLAHAGARVLLVDMDPQGHSTIGLSPRIPEPGPSMYDVFVKEPGAPRTRLRDIRRQVAERLDLAPADIVLAAAPEKLAGVTGRDNILANALDDVRDEYDYVVVDCPPTVGLLTFNALKACAEAIVPVDPSFFSLHGIGKVMETIDLVVRKTGHAIDARVLVTLYSGRTQFARDVVEEIRRHLDGRHFSTIIRHSMKLPEAASHGVPIVTYCRHCAGYEDYQALAAEVVERAGDRPGDAAVTQDVEPASAPHVTDDGVLFTIEAPGAKRVQLVGDFNGWATGGSDMKPAGHLWRSVLALGPGRYRYRYIVDGAWLSDPLNANAEPAPYGGYNSVLVVREEPALSDAEPAGGPASESAHA